MTPRGVGANQNLTIKFFKNEKKGFQGKILKND